MSKLRFPSATRRCSYGLRVVVLRLFRWREPSGMVGQRRRSRRPGPSGPTRHREKPASCLRRPIRRPTTDARWRAAVSSRLGNVSQPTLQVFKPTTADDTGTSVVICPGGGHRILAYDLEGTEVAEWLQSIGVTGIVLKYRVPATKSRQELGIGRAGCAACHEPRPAPGGIARD